MEIMSTAEIKSQIIDKLSSINDEVILKEIFRLVTMESEMDAIYQL